MLLELGKVYLFNCLLVYLLVILILFICFIYFVVIGQGSFRTVEKGLWNNLLIVLEELNETYSEEMANVFSKDAILINDVKHENIIALLGVCDNPATIMLELCEFSMKLFQGGVDFFLGICDKITNDIL